MCLLAGSAAGQSTLINATFDGVPNDANNLFGIISNTQADGSGASWNQTNGVVNRGTATSSTAGAVSVATLDIPSLGSAPIVLTVDVQSASGTLGANGMFIGFQQADGGANAGGELRSNLAECIAGTDPTNALSLFRVLQSNNTVTGFSISWPSVTGRMYAVYWTTNFTDWHLYSQTAGTGAILAETLDKAVIDAADGIPGDLNRCFVRVVAVGD